MSEGEVDELSDISDNSDYFIDNITLEPSVYRLAGLDVPEGQEDS